MQLSKIEVLALLLGVVVFSIVMAPNASAAKKDGSLLKIVDSGPLKNSRGRLTINPDNTYYPGDFFSLTVRIRPDGHHGRAVEGEVKEYNQVARPHPTYWYKSMREKVENGETGTFTKKEDAEKQAEKIENNQDRWAGCDNAKVVEVPMEYGENRWKVVYDEHTWYVQKLKVDPTVRIATGSLGGGSSRPVIQEKNSISAEKGREETTREAKFLVREDTAPGKYYVQITFPVPSVPGDHNNPHENVAEPVVVRENFRVVKYEPKLWQIPYLELGWKPEATNWMAQKPNSIVTRYDGSENESGVLELDRRAVASAVSVSGSMSKPLRANGMFPRLKDDLPCLKEENVRRHRLNLGENITLAKKPDGSYYESGALVSPVLDMGENVENNEWGMRYAVQGKADIGEYTTPSGTNVEFYLIASDTNQTSGAGILQGKVGVRSEGRYIQYIVVLYTKNDSNTPVVDKIEIETHEYTPYKPPEEDWKRHIIQENWYKGGEDFLDPEIVNQHPEREPKGVRFKMELESYLAVRKPEVYHEGDALLTEMGTPKTAKIPLKPVVDNNERVPRAYFRGTYQAHAVEMKMKVKKAKDRLKKRGVLEKTNTLEGAPSYTYIWFTGVEFMPKYGNGEGGYMGETIYRENQWIFPFENGYFVYGPSNRYKKWEIFWYPYPRALAYHNPPNGPPKSKIKDWYKDVKVSARVNFWFHQKVSGWNNKAKQSVKKLFSSDLTWSQMSTYQPVQVAAWELKDDFEDEVLDNPSMVFQDNVWKVDKDVKFDLTFTGMNDPENFLKMSRRAAKQLGPIMTAGNGEIQKIDPASENVVKSFKFPEPRPHGLAYGKNCLWGVGRGSENSGDETIYKLDHSDGDVVRKLAPPSSNLASIAWDGQYLWIARERARTIHKIDPADGTVVGTISSPGFRPLGLAWGDNGLWYADEALDNIYRLDPSTGNTVQELPLQNFNPSPLAWGNRFLWIASGGSLTSSGKIRKLNPRTGSVVDSFTLPGPNPSALAWGDRYLWTAIPGSETGFENAIRRLVESENFRKRMAEMGLSVGKEGVEGLRGSLLALANMDNEMMNMILRDWEIENVGAQSISGNGLALENINYRIGGYYAISESVRPPEENVVRRTEMAKLPFDPDKVANFDINVTGEGLVAEVEHDGPRQATIKIYTPSRAGDLVHVGIYDNENDKLTERNLRSSAFGWIPRYVSAVTSGELSKLTKKSGESSTETIQFKKWKNSPTHLKIRMVNEWGGVAEQELKVSPGRVVGSWETNVNIKWLILAGVLIVLWTSFVKWWKGRRSSGESMRQRVARQRNVAAGYKSGKKEKER